MCAVFKNDPVRCHITLDDILSLTHPQGIDSAIHPTEHPDEWIVQLVTSDLNPNSPNEEHYKEDIERELYKFNIIQDHIREFEPHSHFNSKKSRVIETILNEKAFSKENRYDILLDKAKDIRRLPDRRLFGIIEDS
jgi:hypothetical protein